MSTEVLKLTRNREERGIFSQLKNTGTSTLESVESATSAISEGIGIVNTTLKQSHMDIKLDYHQKLLAKGYPEEIAISISNQINS